MLDHLVELMEDAHDFSWSGSKAAHAVILSRMEDAKIEWEDTNKMERIRRKNQRLEPSKSTKFQNSFVQQKFTPQQLANAPLCEYFNKSSCRYDEHHETRGVIYRHLCATCFAFNKEADHSAKDCTEFKTKSKNGLNPVLAK